MAGDWIKARVGLNEDPAVIGIAALLELDEDMVVGKLIRLWSWADQQTEDGNAPSVTKIWIDRYLSVPRFAEAMEQVGWLIINDGGIQIPDFDKHNSQSAKQRALTAKRVAKFKSKKVTQEALPREEKRREDIKEIRKEKFVKPSLEEITAYCQERENKIDPQTFIDYYTANGWKVGKNPMKDWRAAIRTWEKNDFRRGNQKPLLPEDDREFTTVN